MTSDRTQDITAQALATVDRAVAKVLYAGGAVTPSNEADIQKALLALRTAKCGQDVLERVERISTTLFLMSRAKTNNRPNLFNSQRLKLKRIWSSRRNDDTYQQGEATSIWPARSPVATEASHTPSA